jgi:hypothetical protein
MRSRHPAAFNRFGDIAAQQAEQGFITGGDER